MGYKKLSKEQELTLVQEYTNGANVELLREKYGFATRKSVTDKVKKYYPDKWEEIKQQNKEKQKGYSYKLKKINSNFDAYFIGLMLTDGYVNEERGAIGIDLVDEDCISFLSKSIGKEYNTYSCTGREHEYNRYVITDKKDRHRLLLYDRELLENLKRFSIISRKTDIIQAPQLTKEEEKYLPYLIRGIIDGDGNIDLVNNHVGIRITTQSENFASWIKETLENKMFLQDISICKKNSLFVVETYLTSNIFKIIALCYDQPFGMQRKYKKIREMFRDYNRNFFNTD